MVRRPCILTKTNLQERGTRAQELQEHCCGLIATYNRLVAERNQLMRSAGFQLDTSLPKPLEPPQLDFGDDGEPGAADEAASGDDQVG